MCKVQYLFIFCMALGAACGSEKGITENEAESTTLETTDIEMNRISKNSEDQQSSRKPDKLDTLYRISGTEPFWSMIIARPQIVFTSMEGDTLSFLYQEPQKAAGRPQGYVQVYELGEQQLVVLRQANQCPCSDGMSDIEYPYQATLILKDRILDGCGQAN